MCPLVVPKRKKQRPKQQSNQTRRDRAQYSTDEVSYNLPWARGTKVGRQPVQLLAFPNRDNERLRFSLEHQALHFAGRPLCTSD